MIIIKLQGGLGNQLFQYAFGRALSISSGKPLKFDNTIYSNRGGAYSGDTPRIYRLDAFMIDEQIATTKELGLFRLLSSSKILKRFFRNYITEDQFSVEKKLPKGTVYLDGYWHNQDYFKNIEHILQKELHPKEGFSPLAQKVAARIKRSSCPVSLHIRRGDYVSDPKTNAYHGVCDLGYYQEAIQLIQEKNFILPELFVFSDDIEWAKDNLKSDIPVVFVSSPLIHDYEELLLMSKCRHNIIANSSFSWWGAWLNPTADKIVIAPKLWFADQSVQEKSASRNIVPPEWIRI